MTDNIVFSQFRTKPVRDIPEVSPERLGDNDQFVIVDNGSLNPAPRLMRFGSFKELLNLTDILKNSDKGVPFGIASLDGQGRVPYTQLPTTIVKESQLLEYLKASEKGAPNGIATLTIDRKVPDNQIPTNLIRQTELLAHTLNNNNPHNVTIAQIGAEPAFSILPPSKGGLGVQSITGLIKGTADGYVAAIAGVDYLSANTPIDRGFY